MEVVSPVVAAEPSGGRSCGTWRENQPVDSGAWLPAVGQMPREGAGAQGLLHASVSSFASAMRLSRLERKQRRQPRRTPRVPSSVREEAWCSRHQVAESKQNGVRHQNHRCYFDELPCMTRHSCESGRSTSQSFYNRRAASCASRMSDNSIVAVPEAIPESDTDGWAAGESGLSPHRSVEGCTIAVESLVNWSPVAKPSKTDVNDGVSFQDAEGDRLQFRAGEGGRLDFLSNGRLRLGGVQKLRRDGLKLYLRGVPGSSGTATDWVVPFRSSQQAAVRKLQALFRATPDWCPESEAREVVVDPSLAPGVTAVEVTSQSIKSEFYVWCHKRNGGLAGTWRRLDSDGSMSLHKVEFLKGMKALCFPGSASDVWRCLDSDRSGCVNYIEFDPKGAKLLARFRRWCEQTFGSVVDAFFAFDTDKDNRVTFKELTRECQRVGAPEGLQRSLRTIFRLLDDETNAASRGSIDIREIKFVDGWRCPEYLWVDPDPSARDRFKEVLLAKHHGNPLFAWRKVMDKDGGMRVNFTEFKNVCKRLQDAGVPEASPSSGVSALFSALDMDCNGWFSLLDFDREAFDLLARFTTWSRAEVGRPSMCVRKWEKEKGMGITLGTFQKRTKALGMTTEERDLLFEGLSMDTIEFERPGKKGAISLPEMVFLDGWKPDDDIHETGPDMNSMAGW